MSDASELSDVDTTGAAVEAAVEMLGQIKDGLAEYRAHFDQNFDEYTATFNQHIQEQERQLREMEQQIMNIALLQNEMAQRIDILSQYPILSDLRHRAGEEFAEMLDERIKKLEKLNDELSNA
jgi:septal ring factor EnvC (AmiA/AmiB activator)